MYKCEDCGKVSNPGDKQFKRVAKWKIVTHTDTYKDSEGQTHTTQTAGKKQIVKELVVCKACLEKSMEVKNELPPENDTCKRSNFSYCNPSNSTK